MNILELSEQEIIRRQSLEELRNMGIEPYPAAEYPTDAFSTEIIENFQEPQTDEEGNVLGDFSAKDMDVSALYSYTMGNGLVGGATLHLIHSKYAEYTSTAIGVDVGLHFFDEEKDANTIEAITESIKRVKESSDKEDTKSYNFKGQIDENIKEERLKRLFDVQKKISLQKNKERLSKEYEVIVEDISEDEEYFVCRSMLEAPDVDGRIFIKIDEKSASKVIVGEYAKVKIIDYNDYDLFAEVL